MSETKTVLCYGDSNTWGYIPGSNAMRFSRQLRWPGVLQAELGAEWEVYENGLNGRTTAFEDPFKPGRNGLASLREALEVNSPLDWIVIGLGVNDLKHHLHLAPIDIAQGMRCLVDSIRAICDLPALTQTPPNLLVLSPIAPSESVNQLGNRFADSVSKGKQLAKEYQLVTKELGCHYLDTNQVAEPSSLDGIHLDEKSHRKLGVAVANKLQ